MTEQISFPPLHEPTPSELQRRKQHLLSEISCAPELGRLARARRAASLTHSWSPIRFSRARVVILATSAIVCAAASAGVYVVATQDSPKSPAHTATRGGTSSAIVPAQPLVSPLRLDFTRSGSVITAVAVDVNAPIPNAMLQLQVLRGTTERQVVFQEQLPMTNATPPTGSSTGAVAYSSWSGVLNPSNWTGGCQNASYTVSITVVPQSGGSNSSASGSQTAEAPWFTCSGG
jgi:hypothetical protein